MNDKIKKMIDDLNEEQIEFLKDAVNSRENKNMERFDVAIVGLNGKFPMSNSHYEFWKKISNGESLISEIPGNRWNYNENYEPEINTIFTPGKTRCKYGAFINDIDKFDAAFFDVNPEEVYFMDPQERLALETTWSCIEDSGYKPDDLGKEVGIFTGLTNNEYQKLMPITTHSCLLGNRIAYFFDFHGPAFTIDTGCSSSLSAIHMACMSLKNNECKTAIVIGTNIILHPDHYSTASSKLSKSADPYSRPLGNDDGYIPAEGVVSILLKPLDSAKRDRDNIYAVIKSSIIGQEGRTSWFLASNPKQQAELIQSNLLKSGINPETIGTFEIAANGSLQGDAIEIEGLKTAFKKFTEKKGFCFIGCVKSQTGHAESASTLIQLSKVLLQFKTGILYPILNLENMNRNIKIDNSPFYFIDSKKDWEPPSISINDKKTGIPRRAAISSFGAGGNAGNLILEEYLPEYVMLTESTELYFIPISSGSVEQLNETIKNYLLFFNEIHEFDRDWKIKYTPLNIMHTLCTARKDFKCRVVFLANNIESMIKSFIKYLNNEMTENIISGNVEKNKNDFNNNNNIVDLIEEKKWKELAELWVDGYGILWKEYFNKYKCFRISLPTYCFRKETYDFIGKEQKMFS